MKNKKELSTLLITFLLVLTSFSNITYAAFYYNGGLNGTIIYANKKAANIKSVNQGNTNWCWASAITNVNNILNKNSVTVKKVVQLGTGKTDVDESKGGSTKNMKQALDKLNIKYSYSNSALSLSLLKNQLIKGSPILASLKNTTGLDHVVTIVGFAEKTNQIIYLDSSAYAGKYSIAPKSLMQASFSQFNKLWYESFYNLK